MCCSTGASRASGVPRARYRARGVPDVLAGPEAPFVACAPRLISATRDNSAVSSSRLSRSIAARAPPIVVGDLIEPTRFGRKGRSVKMTLAEFRDALHSLGLSQRDMAERLGLAFSTVSRWARDLAPVPQYACAYLELLAAHQKTQRQLAALTDLENLIETLENRSTR